MRFYYSIASGSKGNCGLYMAGGTAVLIDAGVSLRKITTALASVGLTLEQIAALLVTHEHIDHIKGLSMLLKKSAVPVYASQQTADALAGKEPASLSRVVAFTPGDSLRIGALTVESFPTPHDTPGSVGYILEWAGSRFGFATDLGFVPAGAAARLRGCDAVVLESNHDPNMLQMGRYPYPLKIRISGPAGHLSNPDCADFAADLVKHGAKTIILAHLSEQNNMPELALQQTRLALEGLPPCAVHVAPRDRMEAPVRLPVSVQSPAQAKEGALCSIYG